MNVVNPYLKQYQKNQVETATPEKVLILLYDGAIQYLNKAKIGMEQNNIEQIHNNILACENIILEFMNSLNMEEGGALAQNLYRLYEYLYRTLVTANLKKDEKKLDEVLIHLKGLRETWQKAIEIANNERPTINMMDDAEDRIDSYERTYSDEEDDSEEDEEE